MPKSGRRVASSERELVSRLEALFAPGSGAVARIGIGDDAAVLRALRGSAIWTVDTSVEGVHFDRRFLSSSEIGARSFHAAVSDVAAMGARPQAALSSLIIPSSFPERRLLELVAGQAKAARELRCPIVGGNLSRGSELSVTTTVLGTAKRPLTRSGARPGDEVWLVGDVGLARVGLLVLQRKISGRGLGAEQRRGLAACVTAWRRPRALVREGQRLVGRARAAIDVSDGLGADAAQIASASSVRLVVEGARLLAALRPELAVASRMLRATALSVAVAGGEDYALLATGPRARRPRGAHVIGRIEKGRGAFLEDDSGLQDLTQSGFDHFRPIR